MTVNQKQSWQDYQQQELAKVKPILKSLGFVLTDEQPLIGGERYLSSVKKLVLIASSLKDKQKVIIKVASSEEGQAEIKQEYNSRKTLAKINFAYNIFLAPKEILFKETNGLLIFITEFINQDYSFIQRPLIDQFFLSLKLFSLQEGAQAVTYEHQKLIAKDFGIWQAKDYLQQIDKYLIELQNNKIDISQLKAARELFVNNLSVVDLYCGFLAHWDLVPHNFRIKDNDIYLLDHSSLRFGNKYESWARFINFMSLYNPELEKLLVEYVKDNRDNEEFLSLKLMRVYRLLELIWHYTNSLAKADDNVLVLNKKRIDFWSEALQALLADKFLDKKVIADYQQSRDALRDEAEKKRQAEIY